MPYSPRTQFNAVAYVKECWHPGYIYCRPCRGAPPNGLLCPTHTHTHTHTHVYVLRSQCVEAAAYSVDGKARWWGSRRTLNLFRILLSKWQSKLLSFHFMFQSFFRSYRFLPIPTYCMQDLHHIDTIAISDSLKRQFSWIDSCCLQSAPVCVCVCVCAWVNDHKFSQSPACNMHFTTLSLYVLPIIMHAYRNSNELSIFRMLNENKKDRHAGLPNSLHVKFKNRFFSHFLI